MEIHSQIRRCEASAIAATRNGNVSEGCARALPTAELKRESLMEKRYSRRTWKKKKKNVARSETCAPLADVSRLSKLFPTSVHTCDFYKVPTGREHTVLTLKPLPPPPPPSRAIPRGT